MIRSAQAGKARSWIGGSYKRHARMRQADVGGRTLWAVRTAEEARDSNGVMGTGVRFMIACAAKVKKILKTTDSGPAGRHSVSPTCLALARIGGRSHSSSLLLDV